MLAMVQRGRDGRSRPRQDYIAQPKVCGAEWIACKDFVYPQLLPAQIEESNRRRKRKNQPESPGSLLPNHWSAVSRS